MPSPPTTAKGRATLQRMLDAACVLFARQGIRATTLDQVQAASATGRSQMYSYFADKADLVTAVVNQQVERVLEAQEPVLGSIATAADVRRWCQLAAQQYAADDPVRCPIGSLIHELGEQDLDARAALAAGFARWHTALATGLRRVRDNGELAPYADPDGAASALLAAYQGGVLLTAATGDHTLLTEGLTTVAAGILLDS
jgi:TetR/AcrR family transcriptional repressor of nem operon